MTISETTTWPELEPSNYLTSDYFEKNEEKALTVKEVKLEKVLNPKINKSEDKLVAYWEEDLPPMILGAKKTRRALTEVTGTNRPAKWTGARVLVYFDPDVKFGKEKVGGLRVRNYPPKDAKQEPAANQVSCSVCNQYITHADPEIQAATVTKSIEQFGAPVCISCWNKKKAGEA